ncbi:MAG: tetraacyldisaccharide 4'-kinase [Gemmatimonadota bacterium]
MRWLWTSRRADARLARLALLPASGLWRTATAARVEVYARGWLRSVDLALPTVAIGNLTVGGSGRTAVTLWAARHFLDAGVRPGVLLHDARAAGNAMTHALPHAIVVNDVDRAAAAARARAAGARVLVLDDAFQQLAISRAMNVAVVSAESARAVSWALPAGPWRENRATGLGRADAVVITRRRATPEAAEALAAELRSAIEGPVAIAQLGLRQLQGLVSGSAQDATLLAGRRVVAATGSADPDAFVAHVKATGAAVQVATWKDQDELRDADVAWLAHAARRADHVVITERDAVRLRDRWPANVPEPLVAVLDLKWEDNGDAIAAGLDRVAAGTSHHL